MSYTSRNTIICDECGLFCRPVDEYTPFGCSSYDPPEPLPPSHICQNCFPKVKEEWIKEFKKGGRHGYWQKSKAEIEAAKECGLAWVCSGGHGMLGTKDFVSAYRYISQEEYDRLAKLPYYGYCKLCGAENKRGYCSDKKCQKSFQYNKIKKEDKIVQQLD